MIKLEVALARLEEIAAQLEVGELDLEASLALYREARELHGACVERLAQAEQELAVLLEDGRLASDPHGETSRD